jgi:hypothetical protein
MESGIVRLRGLTQRDFQPVDSLWKKHHAENFGLPSSKHNVTSAVVENDGKVVGFGLVKVLAEAIMVLDLDVSVPDRLTAMQMLMDEAIRACKDYGIEQLHVFVKDERLSRLLQNKYAFSKVSDEVLVLGV